MTAGSADKILDEAWSIGVRAFDTAEAYGSAAAVLARWLDQHSRIGDAAVVTKVTAVDCISPAPVERAVARFNGARSVTILSHGALEASAWAAFSAAARKSGADAGQSVYTGAEVTNAAALGAVRVQAPGNVVDARQLDAAHAAPVPIDVRSVFLQGVLADIPDVAEQRVPGAGWMSAELHKCAAAHGLTPPVALLAAVSSMVHPRDRVVIGIDSASQVADLESALSVPASTAAAVAAAMSGVRRRALATPHILDPRTWP